VHAFTLCLLVSFHTCSLLFLSVVYFMEDLLVRQVHRMICEGDERNGAVWCWWMVERDELWRERLGGRIGLV
jgi:hypothetical protein